MELYSFTIQGGEYDNTTIGEAIETKESGEDEGDEEDEDEGIDLDD